MTRPLSEYAGILQHNKFHTTLNFKSLHRLQAQIALAKHPQTAAPWDHQLQ